MTLPVWKAAMLTSVARMRRETRAAVRFDLVNTATGQTLAELLDDIELTVRGYSPPVDPEADTGELSP